MPVIQKFSDVPEIQLSVHHFSKNLHDRHHWIKQVTKNFKTQANIHFDQSELSTQWLQFLFLNDYNFFEGLLVNADLDKTTKHNLNQLWFILRSYLTELHKIDTRVAFDYHDMARFCALMTETLQLMGQDADSIKNINTLLAQFSEELVKNYGYFTKFEQLSSAIQAHVHKMNQYIINWLPKTGDKKNILAILTVSNATKYLFIDAINKGLVIPASTWQAQNSFFGYDKTILEIAIMFDFDVEVVKKLVAQGVAFETNNENFPLLHDAIMNKRIEIAQFFVEQMSDIDNPDFCKNTPLKDALELKPTPWPLVTTLLKKGANAHTKNIHGVSPWFLILQMKAGVPEEILSLVIDSPHFKVNDSNEFGMTPLHIALSQQNHRLAKRLIEKGADLDVVDNNMRTPLHVAISINAQEIVALLLSCGVNMHIQADKWGSAIECAAHFGNITCLDLLIKQGALTPKYMQEGINALNIALQHRSALEVIALLRAGVPAFFKKEENNIGAEILALLVENIWSEKYYWEQPTTQGFNILELVTGQAIYLEDANVLPFLIRAFAIEYNSNVTVWQRAFAGYDAKLAALAHIHPEEQQSCFLVQKRLQDFNQFYLRSNNLTDNVKHQFSATALAFVNLIDLALFNENIDANLRNELFQKCNDIISNLSHERFPYELKMYVLNFAEELCTLTPRSNKHAIVFEKLPLWQQQLTTAQVTLAKAVKFTELLNYNEEVEAENKKRGGCRIL